MCSVLFGWIWCSSENFMLVVVWHTNADFSTLSYATRINGSFTHFAYTFLTAFQFCVQQFSMFFVRRTQFSTKHCLRMYRCVLCAFYNTKLHSLYFIKTHIRIIMLQSITEMKMPLEWTFKQQWYRKEEKRNHNVQYSRYEMLLKRNPVHMHMFLSILSFCYFKMALTVAIIFILYILFRLRIFSHILNISSSIIFE